LDVATDQRGKEPSTPPARLTEARDAESRPAIPPRLAPSLTAAGGLLLALGGLGTWIRATRVPAGGSVEEQVAAIAGRSESGGWILFAVGIAAAIAAFAWTAGAPRVRAAAGGISLVVIGLASIRLALIDGRAAELASQAASSPDLDAFHAGFGWGAWLLLLAVVLLGLSVLVGALKEVERRRAR
jgi:hypothetical protein